MRLWSFLYTKSRGEPKPSRLISLCKVIGTISVSELNGTEAESGSFLQSVSSEALKPHRLIWFPKIASVTSSVLRKSLSTKSSV